ncbi:MAG TPA: terminase, partial [Acidimicrobiia bacterium]
MRPRPQFTLGPEVAAWIETFCVHGPGDVLGQPVQLTRDEKRFLAWAYEVDADGRRIVRRAVRGLPKGSRKTEFAAWLCLAEMAGPVRVGKWEDEKPRGQRVPDPYVVAAAASY